MNKYDKQRLFEVMSNIDKTFRLSINESFDLDNQKINENEPIAIYDDELYNDFMKRIKINIAHQIDPKNNPIYIRPNITVKNTMKLKNGDRMVR